MNYLIDTHCFLWSLFSPEKCSTRVAAVLRDGDNSIHISAVSFWEISIKHALGKLTLEGITPGELAEAARAANYTLIPMHADQAATFRRLPVNGHRDPFDRMLVWQAIQLPMTLISRDAALSQYTDQGLNIVW
jgi:PIN domain nuclease of toxin-antitoxin system